MPGTAQWAALHQQFFDELTVTAERAGDWGFVGALCIANNFVADADRQDSRFLAILDRALLVMRDDGVAFAAIPPYALRRWEEVHGTEGLSPAAWPSALAHLAVPPSPAPFRSGAPARASSWSSSGGARRTPTRR
jgi:hypothetical protein